MNAARFAGAALLLGVAVGMLWILNVPTDVGVDGTYPIRIDGPDGVIFNATVTADEATVMDVLLAASDKAGFDVDYSGTGKQAFVHAIAGVENEGMGGWCYAVYRGQWFTPVVGAGAYPLEQGDQVWWKFYADGCPSF